MPAHVTLLGPTEVDARLLPAVERHLEAVAAAQPPFTIHLRGTGTFRPITEVVFVTLAVGISECELLAGAIAAAEGVHRDVAVPVPPARDGGPGRAAARAGRGVRRPVRLLRAVRGRFLHAVLARRRRAVASPARLSARRLRSSGTVGP